MNMNVFDVEGLKNLGISFSSEEEAEEFSKVVQENLYLEIGNRMQHYLSDSQVDEFEKIHSAGGENASVQWIREKCPNYSMIVRNTIYSMKIELLEWIFEIPGVVRTEKMTKKRALVDKLLLDLETTRVLERHSIDTVGELDAIEDFSEIDGLSRNQIREIRRKLANYMLAE